MAGEALVDIVQTPQGSEVYAAGGSPMNVAVGLGRLGVATTLVTQIGDDDLGRLLIDHVTGSGVLLAPGSIRTGARTSTATARLDEHLAASYDFDLHWDPATHELPESATGLHVGSLGAMLEPGRRLVAHLVAQAVRRDLFVSYDPNVRAQLVDDRDRTWREVRALARQATLVKLSNEDCLTLRPDRPASDSARELLQDTPLVVMTRGGSGASAYTLSASTDVPAKPGSVVDTVGAGDSFMAALIAALLDRGWATKRAWTETELVLLLEAAGLASAVTCSRRGADPPTRRELGPRWPLP